MTSDQITTVIAALAAAVVTVLTYLNGVRQAESAAEAKAAAVVQDKKTDVIHDLTNSSMAKMEAKFLAQEQLTKAAVAEIAALKRRHADKTEDRCDEDDALAAEAKAETPGGGKT